MYSRKKISQNSFPNLIYIFPKSFMIFYQELQDPKRNYKNQVWTLALKDVIIKKLHTLDSNSGPPCRCGKYYVTGPSKQIPEDPTYQYLFQSELTRTHSCRSLLLVWQICSLNWDLDMNSFVGIVCIWLWWSNVKILTNVAGVLPGFES
jgi:hypothetical protein